MHIKNSSSSPPQAPQDAEETQRGAKRRLSSSLCETSASCGACGGEDETVQKRDHLAASRFWNASYYLKISNND
jgi:hypothetical protein